MPLTDAMIRALRFRDKDYKAPDAKGLHLLVIPSGWLLWKFKYRAQGNTEKMLSLGSYLELSLREARG